MIASGVAGRTREIGVRMALGAHISRLFVSGGLRLAAVGVTAGALLALGVGRLVSSVVWGVRPFDVGVLAAAAVLLTVAALLASWLPARRAVGIQPLDTLRLE